MNHMTKNPMAGMPHHHWGAGHPPMGQAHPHPPHPHGFCISCCHPAAKCLCHRQCLKESKELLVKAQPLPKLDTSHHHALNTISAMMKPLRMTTATAEQPDARSKTDDAAHVDDAISIFTNLAAATRTGKILFGQGSAVIGGGCCVHLSVEYMPTQTALDLVPGGATGIPGVILIYVLDSKGTVLAWGKVFKDSYTVKQDIITTNPGAQLLVYAVNAIVRVRWCEIFSC